MIQFIKDVWLVAWRFPIDTLFTLSAFIVVPIVCLFVSNDAKHLPKLFRWYETYDNPANGSAWWQKEHGTGYWARVQWLWRNPAGRWSYEVMGIQLDKNTKFSFKGTPGVSDSGQKPGWIYAHETTNGKTYPVFYAVFPWSKTRCLRIYLGWKFDGNSTDTTKWDRTSKNGKRQYVCMIWPFHGYGTKS